MKEEKSKVTLWEFFQSLGKTFMLPVALLAAMGILLGIGAGFSGSEFLRNYPMFDHTWIQLIFKFMTNISLVVFSFLPLLFAVAIPLGLAKENKEIAAFSGVVGYIAMQLGTNFIVNLKGISETHSILGITSIDTGVLGGLASGIIVYFIHRNTQYIELPDAFSFFGGTRFVAIATSVIMCTIGLVVPYVWPYLSMGIEGIGKLIQKAGIFGPFMFGTGERLLLPFGLHHILVSTIRFTEAGGTYIAENGEKISGALNIFYEQFKEGPSHVDPHVTRFLSQGKMPSFIFGLSGAALAMYKSALLENRKKVKGLLLSAVIAAAVGGITEPIEFIFLFIAPVLYLFHAIMTGLGFMVMGILGVAVGNTDGNLIDLLVFGILQGSWTKWFLVLPVGAIWFTLYYFVFKWYIGKHDIKTPGREVMEEGSEGKGDIGSYTAQIMLDALGGADNIVNLDNCITRLRLVVKDSSIIDVDGVKGAGAVNVVILDKTNVQVIIGPKVQVMKKYMSKLL